MRRNIVALLALPCCAFSTGAFAAEPSPSDTSGVAAAQQNKFDILEFRVLGNHVLPARDVERAVYPFLGQGKDFDAVKKASEALEKVYKDAGYGTVFVDIPEQTVDDGIVRLKVTEGTLERVRIRGEKYFSGRQIRAALPALAAGQTPHLPTLQEELTQLNARSNDRSITPVLKAGAEPGTVDIDLAVKDNLPLHLAVEADNRHTADTTPNRASVSLSYDNLWQRQDSISFQYQTAPANRDNAGVEQVTYLGHAGSSGGIASISYIHTSSNVLALGTLGVLGKGDIYGAHWLQPITNTVESSRSWNFGADYKDVLTTVFPDSQSNSSGTTGSGVAAPVTAKVKYLNWSIGYSQAWRAQTHGFGTTLGLGFGIRDLLNSPAEFENARSGGSPNYVYLRFSADANYSLPASFAVTGRITSQWSMNPLVNNEQFSLGGMDTVRGYLEAETLGDSGAAGSVELHGPPLAGNFALKIGRLYPLAFVDAGVATLLEPLPSQNYKFHLWSTGVGLRLENGAGFSGALDWAIPEKDGVRTRKHESRFDFMFRYGF